MVIDAIATDTYDTLVRRGQLDLAESTHDFFSDIKMQLAEIEFESVLEGLAEEPREYLTNGLNLLSLGPQIHRAITSHLVDRNRERREKDRLHLEISDYENKKFDHGQKGLTTLRKPYWLNRDIIHPHQDDGVDYTNRDIDFDDERERWDR